MPRYGAIYIAHNPRDGEDIFKVGKTDRSVAERMAELTADTSNIGTYTAKAAFVVTDVDAAEKACHNHRSMGILSPSVSRRVSHRTKRANLVDLVTYDTAEPSRARPD